MWQLDWSKLTEVLTYDAGQPMIFSSGLFLFLFLGFSLIYMLLKKQDTARILFVTLFSYYFYYKISGFYFFLLGVVTLTDYWLALCMVHTETKWKRKT
ncbi:MAG: MBOAT family protein, partial [Phocaeicola sp.]|nr:MBOAT family protein [Phocaeicola sp.]